MPFQPAHLPRRLTLVASLLTACPQPGAAIDGDTDAATTTGETDPPPSTGTSDTDPSTGAATPTSTGETTAAAPDDCLPVTLDDVPVSVVALGTHPPGAELCFDLPAGVLGFTVIASSPAGEFGLASLLGPQGAAEIDDSTLGATSLRYHSEELEPLLAAVPQRSAKQALPPAPGQWRLRLGEGSAIVPATEIELELWLRRAAGPVPDRLNVNVFAAPATIAAKDAEALVALAFAEFAGLELGTVQVFALPDTATVIDEADLAELWAGTAAVDPAPALNVIMAAELSTGSFSLLGITPSIPGPARRHGTRASGIAIQVSGDPAFDAIVLAHESGHYAGLLHTTESGILGTFDALDDTPECLTPGNIMFCPDHDNVMFYAAANVDTPGKTLSPQQQAVIQASALYDGDAPGPVGRLPRPPARPGPATDELQALSPATRTALLACARVPARPERSPGESRTLLRLADQPWRPLAFRRQALALAGLAADAAGIVHLQAIAADLDAPRALRLGATQGLWVAGQRRLVAALADDADPAVAQAARSRLER